MKLTFQQMIESDDQPPVITELLSVDRSTLDPSNVGLHLSEARELLAHSQSAMVKAQVTSFNATASQCPSCQRSLGRKGHHQLVYRTVFGTLRFG